MKSFLNQIDLVNFIALDLETTGLDSERDKIIEISAYRFSKGRPVDSFTSLINPEIKINNITTQITGIVDSMLINQPKFEDVKDDFIAFIQDFPIVGHNIMFDLSFLDNNMSNYNEVFNNRIVCDTFYLSKIFYYHFNSFSLSSLCHSLDILILNAHRAEEDAKNAGLLFFKILEDKLFKADLLLMQKLNNCIKNYNVPNKYLFDKIIKYLLSLKNEERQIDTISSDIRTNFSLDYKSPQNVKEDISIDDLFASDGILENNFELFELREQQVKFCKDIYEILKNDSFLIAEAGAGLGKSYAYLFACMLYMRENNSQIVISTNTHNLQNQLFNKDIPFVVDILKYDCKITIIKGISNYICLKRLEDIINNIENKLNALEAMEIMSLFVWLEDTLTGDISECNGFNMRRYYYLWSMINAKSEYCLTSRCNKYDGCYYKSIRESALNSDILIVNHSMLISYYDNYDSFIRDNSICVIDECHNFHSICQKQLSKQINVQSLNEQKHDYISIIQNLEKNSLNKGLVLEGKSIIKIFDNSCKIFSDLCYEIFSNHVISPTDSEYIQNTSINTDGLFIDDKLSSKNFLYNYNSNIDSIKEHKAKIKDNQKNINNKDSLQDIELLLKDMENYYLVAKMIINNKDDSINWFSYSYKNENLEKIALNSSPSNLQEVTNDIFGKFSSTILCSATLSTDSGFDFFVRQMGLKNLVYQDNIKLKKYPSPYFYQDQSKLFVINTHNEVNDKEHMRRVANDIMDISLSSNKRILVLCTSFKQIYDFQMIVNTLPEIEDRCLFQTKGVSREILMSEYLKYENSILFGTNTFWEGIDLPKDKLEILFIFKLPFSNPNDPYVKANIEYYKSRNLDAFSAYQLEDTILKLKQGFGRLIRSYDDMGICIITDPRITKRRYGHHVLNSLPVEPINYSSPLTIIESINHFLK